MEDKKIKKIYTKVLNLVKDMSSTDFYKLLTSLERGYEAYCFLGTELDMPEDKDDIEEIEEDLND